MCKSARSGTTWRTPAAGGSAWRNRRALSFCPRPSPATRRYLLTTCRGEGSVVKAFCLETFYSLVSLPATKADDPEAGGVAVRSE